MCARASRFILCHIFFRQFQFPIAEMTDQQQQQSSTPAAVAPPKQRLKADEEKKKHNNTNTNTNKKFIHGLSAFPITPQSPDGKVDTAALARLVKRLVDARVHSVGLLGSTGTYAFLDREQRRRAIETAADILNQAAAGDLPRDVHSGDEGAEAEHRTRRRPLLLVGVGHLRTDCAIEIAKDALAAGADAGLLSPVSYNPLKDEEVFEHFRAIAEAVPELPLVIYNNEVRRCSAGCVLCYSVFCKLFAGATSCSVVVQ